MSETLEPSGSKFRLPSEPSVITVTPDMASDWLSYRNHPKNRPLSKAVAAKYQADMESGRWREATPEGLIFDTDGWIISGQHRLKAVANSGRTVRFWVFPDEARDIFDVLDQGYKRTPAHVLRVPHAVAVANGARHLAALADGGLSRYNRITTPEIVATVRAWPELTWCATEAAAVYAATRIPVGVHLAVLAQADRSYWIARISDWLDGLRSGAGLPGGDPRLLLRERFRAGLTLAPGVPRHDLRYALIVKAWNAFAEDRSLRSLRWRRDEALPTVVGLDPARVR